MSPMLAHFHQVRPMGPDQSGDSRCEKNQECGNRRPVVGPEPLIHFPSVVNLALLNETLGPCRSTIRSRSLMNENPFSHTCRLFAAAVSNLRLRNSSQVAALVFVLRPGQGNSSKWNRR